jgi:acetylglutamate kinase
MAGGGRRLTLRVGIEPHFRDGLRVTDTLIMEVIEMVLAAKVNKNLVSLVNFAGGAAVGLCGKDARLFTALCLFLYVLVSFLFLHVLVPGRR